MIIKFILLGSMCWNFHDVGTQCTQYLVDNLSDATICREKAISVGRSNRDKIEELGGFMDHYRVHCMAIDSEGYNVDHSFEISYNIL
jgi:hypothetical protein|tara:strand:+ start:857 stop:1117 length:261 start_codon:yes stop_codon:yes gene_type:complete